MLWTAETSLEQQTLVFLDIGLLSTGARTPNMTNLFQPLDITVNRYAKRYIRNLYSAYYTGEVCKQLDCSVAPCEVKINLKLSKLKPMHADWLFQLYNDMQSRPELIKKGFDKAGITAASSMGYLMDEIPSMKMICDETLNPHFLTFSC